MPVFSTKSDLNLFIILYNAYFLQPGFIASSPNWVLTSHLAPSSVGSKGIQGMYAFSQIPFNGSLFLEIKSHNPYHDQKKKFFFKFFPGVSVLLLSILPYCSPHSLCSSHTSLLAACWAAQAHCHLVIFAWIVLPQRMLVPKPFMWWNPHFKILLRDFPGGQVVENLPANA